MFTLPKNSTPTLDNIRSAISYNEKLRKNLNELEKYYNGSHKILNSSYNDRTTRKNKIVINHAEYITDVNVGYLLGSPVDYKSEDVDIEPIMESYKVQTISDLDNEIGTTVSIMGYAYEYVYLNEEKEVRSTMVDPRNCIIAYDNTVEHKKLFAVIYGSKFKDKDLDNPWYENVIVVTANEVIEYSNSATILSTSPHIFKQVPVIEYRNNPRTKGDFESVMSLIDAYNLLQSDRVNDKEQLVNSILLLYGFVLTAQQIQEVKENRVLSIPAKLQGTAAEYLTKTMQESDVQILSDKIESDIHKISKTPNLSDDSFSGNSSGVAIKYKLLVFEQNVRNKERYFEKGLKERLNLYYKGINLNKATTEEFNVQDVEVVFTRSLPQNDLETSQMINNLTEVVDKESLVSQLSFVKDASEVVEKKKEESEENMQKMSGQFGTNEPNKNNLDNNKENDRAGNI